jgi:UDP-glucose 4-epimerase
LSNVLITGGCGFIGRNLIRMLLERGDSIRVLDNLSVGTRDELALVANIIECNGWQAGGNVSLCVGDIRDRHACMQAAEGADAVVHLAAQSGVLPSIENPVFDCETNVLGIVNMLEACKEKGAGHFVFASSSAPLGETVPPIHEEMVAKPLSPYGASKLAGEGYCSAYSSSFDIKTSVLRFSNVYGPDSGHKGSVVALFFRRALEGKPLIVYGSGGQTRDFIYRRFMLGDNRGIGFGCCR